MGLYDNYKLANSSEIPRFEGSAGAEFVHVGNYKQGVYDQALQQGTDLGVEANEIDSSLAKDKPAAEELRNMVKGKLQDLAQKGDWENALPSVHTLGQQYANRAKEILAPQQAASAYRTSLAEKDKNLTPEQQSSLYAMSVAGYQGLSKDARGRYVGQFSGVTPAKNIDVNKKVDEWLKDTAAHEGGTEYEFTQDGDMWITKNGEKIKQVSKQRLGAILKAAQDNDTEYQSFKQMEGKIAGFNGAQSIQSLDHIKSDSMRSDTKAVMDKYGIPLQQAYGLVAEQTKHNEIDDAARTYGLNKYNVDNKFTTHDIKDNPYTLKDHKEDETGTGGPYIFQGPDSKLTNDEKDFNKLQVTNKDTKQNMSLVQQEITKLAKDLQGTLSPSTRAQKQSDLTNAQNRLEGLTVQSNRAETITGYSRDVTAQGLGYNDYNDFYSKNNKGLLTTINKSYPNGIMTSSGRAITKEDLTQAAAEGRIVPNQRPGVIGAEPQITGATITLKDGTQVPIDGRKGIELYSDVRHSLQTDSKRVADFNDKLKQTHAENVKDFAIQSANIQIPEHDRAEMTTVMKGIKDGIRFSEPGQLQPTEAPDNFRVVSAGITATGRDNKVQVEELDKDGKPTGKYYDAVFSGNAREKLARQYGASKSPDAKLVADMMTTGSGASTLMQAIPGMTISAGQVLSPKSKDADPIQASIRIIRHPDKSVSYELVDDAGNSLRPPTDNVGEAGAWIDAIQGRDTYSNGRKTLIQDRGRTKEVKPKE